MNRNLTEARKQKNDEFYTQVKTVESELAHYRDHFRDKVVYCNCDDPEKSAFVKYFTMNFESLGLKKLIATHCDRYADAFKVEVTRGDGGPVISRTPLDPAGFFPADGDFRSPECVALLEEADIVVTNPPFSLFREYIALLVDQGKKFLIVGHQNAVAYRSVFPLIRGGRLWLGWDSNKCIEFKVPKHYPKWSREDEEGQRYAGISGVVWFTNLEHGKRNERLVARMTYEGNEEHYPKYDNYNAIEVGKVADIPEGYTGLMAVPITYLGKHCPDQFEILGTTGGTCDGDVCAWPTKRYVGVFQHTPGRNAARNDGAPNCTDIMRCTGPTNSTGMMRGGGPINSTGMVQAGNANTAAVLALADPPTGVYYTAANADGFLIAKYKRLIIRLKQP